MYIILLGDNTLIFPSYLILCSRVMQLIIALVILLRWHVLWSTSYFSCRTQIIHLSLIYALTPLCRVMLDELGIAMLHFKVWLHQIFDTEKIKKSLKFWIIAGGYLLSYTIYIWFLQSIPGKSNWISYSRSRYID